MPLYCGLIMKLEDYCHWCWECWCFSIEAQIGEVHCLRPGDRSKVNQVDHCSFCTKCCRLDEKYPWKLDQWYILTETPLLHGRLVDDQFQVKVGTRILSQPHSLICKCDVHVTLFFVEKIRVTKDLCEDYRVMTLAKSDPSNLLQDIGLMLITKALFGNGKVNLMHLAFRAHGDGYVRKHQSRCIEEPSTAARV